MGLSERKNVCVVLIETEQAGNLGSVARAMGNMGLSDLRLVRPKANIKHNDAKAMAMAAYPLLKKARVTQTFSEALDGCHLAMGFTRRRGRQRREFLDMKEFSSFVQKSIAEKQKIALVFGPESRGFTTEEASACQLLVRIPSSTKHPSLNLAQAVIVVAYELQREKWKFEAIQKSSPATIEDLEGMYGHLQEVLEVIRFTDAQNPTRIPRVLRRLFNRAHPTKQEVRIVRGLCRNVLYELGRK